MDGKMAASLTLICANQKIQPRREQRKSGDDDKKKDKASGSDLVAALLAASCAAASSKIVSPIKRDDNGSERIPTCIAALETRTCPREAKNTAPPAAKPMTTR